MLRDNRRLMAHALASVLCHNKINKIKERTVRTISRMQNEDDFVE